MSTEAITRRGIPISPLLRRMAAVTATTTIGNGATMTIVVLYFTMIVGIPVGQVAIAMSLGGLTAFALSTHLGILADRLDPPRAMRIAYFSLAAVALALMVTPNVWWLVAVMVILNMIESISKSMRNMYVARACASDGLSRVSFMAYLRAVTNVGLSVGTLIAAIPLAVGTPLAYQAMFVVDALSFVAAGLIAGTLPALPSLVNLTTGAADNADMAGDSAEDADGTGESAPVGERRRVWRDYPYVLITMLSAIFALHFLVTEIAMPLWIVQDTEAPDWLVSVAFLTNTVMVALFQVRLSRGSSTVKGAAHAFIPASIAIVIGFALIAFASIPGAFLAGVLIIAGATAHVVGEMVGSGGQWGVQFGLAPMERQGEYQGLSSAMWAGMNAVGPVIVAFLCVENGITGWFIMAALIAIPGLLITPVARWAMATRAHYGVATHTG